MADVPSMLMPPCVCHVTLATHLSSGLIFRLRTISVSQFIPRPIASNARCARARPRDLQNILPTSESRRGVRLSLFLFTSVHHAGRLKAFAECFNTNLDEYCCCGYP